MNIVAWKLVAGFNLPLNISALYNPCATAIYYIRGTSVLLTSGCPSNVDAIGIE